MSITWTGTKESLREIAKATPKGYMFMVDEAKGILHIMHTPKHPELEDHLYHKGAEVDWGDAE